MLVVALPFISFACRNEMNIFGPQCFKLQHRDRYNSQNFRDVRRENVKKENAAGIKVCISWLDAIEKHWRVFFFFSNVPQLGLGWCFLLPGLILCIFLKKKILKNDIYLLLYITSRDYAVYWYYWWWLQLNTVWDTGTVKEH